MKPSLSFVWFVLAAFLTPLGAFSRAQTPSTAAAPSPTDPATVSANSLEEAQKLLRAGKLHEAEAAYNELSKTNNPAPAYAGLARVYLKQHRVADADAAAAKSMELAPGSDFAKIAVAEVRFRQGRIAEAETIFTALVRANSAEARAYYGLGRVYWVTSYYQHAKLMFDMANERDPQDPEIHRRWLYTLTRKERLAEWKGMAASGDDDEDSDEKEHLHTGLVLLTDAEEQNRKGCRLVSTVKESHQNLEKLFYNAQRIRGYGLKVNIDGAKGTLLLDTGASGILINRRMAQKAAIEPIVHTDVHGIGDKGPVAAYIGYGKSIKIGDVEFQNCIVRVEDRNNVADEEGLIGADVFNMFLVDINFPDYKFNLTPLPPMPPPSDREKALIAKYPNIARFRDRIIPNEFKTFSSVFRFNHLLLIPARINQASTKLFLIDTGAFSNTISPAAAREVTKVRSGTPIVVKGVTGEVNKVFTADDITLTFSHFAQPARDMVAFDMTGISNGAGTEVTGTLGLAMLYQMDIKIDYRDGLVDFGYDPKRFH